MDYSNMVYAIKASDDSVDLFSCRNDSGSSWLAAYPFSEREKMPDNAKTLLHPDSYGRNIFLKIADVAGYVHRDEFIMSNVVDVEVIQRQYKSQVIVRFADSTFETATLAYNDEFDLEQGISICITKKLLSNIVGMEHGGSTYNKLIDRAVKVFQKNEMARAKSAAEEEAKKLRYEKIIAKKKAKREKRKAEERENQIEIQKEAYLRAMRELNTRSAD